MADHVPNGRPCTRGLSKTFKDCRNPDQKTFTWLHQPEATVRNSTRGSRAPLAAAEVWLALFPEQRTRIALTAFTSTSSSSESSKLTRGSTPPLSAIISYNTPLAGNSARGSYQWTIMYEAFSTLTSNLCTCIDGVNGSLPKMFLTIRDLVCNHRPTRKKACTDKQTKQTIFIPQSLEALYWKVKRSIPLLPQQW